MLCMKTRTRLTPNCLTKAIALVLLCLPLAACDQKENANFSGSYAYSSNDPAFNIKVTFDFNEDGTVLWSDGIGDLQNGTYTVSGNEVTATFKDATKKFTREGDALLSDNGLRFERGGS